MTERKFFFTFAHVCDIINISLGIASLHAVPMSD